MRRAALLLSAAILAISGCAGGKATRGAGADIQLDEAVVAAAVRGAAAVSEFKGFGEITLVASGQRVSGTIDAKRRNTGFVNAQIYSPFGSGIASIAAENFAGRVIINKEKFDFRYEDAMDEAPFPCARRFTYGKFINSVTGSMPNIFWELPADEPDTLIRGKKRSRGVTAAWLSDTLTVRAQVSPRTGNLETVTFNYDFGGEKFSMKFSRFKNGVPYEVLVRESAKNYFSISYESMVWK